MTIKTTHTRKPDLLVLLTFCVVAGFLATSVAQADEMTPVDSSRSGQQLKRGLDLSKHLADWRATIGMDGNGKGLHLARPFGKAGPTLRVAPSMPYSVKRSLKDAGDSQIGAVSTGPRAFLFLQKRW